jgi:hypothetical protein
LAGNLNQSNFSQFDATSSFYAKQFPHHRNCFCCLYFNLPAFKPKTKGETIMSDTNPEGAYINVKVVPINGRGNLSNGTGTLSAAGIFSCGHFASGDLPEIGKSYNIAGEHQGRLYEFPGWKCTHSGPTSDFKA